MIVIYMPSTFTTGISSFADTASRSMKFNKVDWQACFPEFSLHSLLTPVIGLSRRSRQFKSLVPLIHNNFVPRKTLFANRNVALMVMASIVMFAIVTLADRCPARRSIADAIGIEVFWVFDLD